MKVSRLFGDNLEAYLSGLFRIIINQGGTSCFEQNQLVLTDNGPKKINEIKEGDLCLSHNLKTGKDEYKKAVSVIRQKNKDTCYKITLKNGQTIIATKNHKFFFNGRWYTLKKLVSLYKKNYERNLENNSVF